MSINRPRFTGSLALVALALAFALAFPLSLPSSAQENPPSIEGLISSLGKGNDRERRDAAYHLSNLGQAAEPAIPALIKALDDDQQQVWFYSLMALANLGPAARDAVPTLMKGIERGSSGRRGRSEGPSQTWYRSAYALGKIGEPALPRLLEGLTNDNRWVRSGATKALTWVQPQPTSAIPALINNLKDSDGTVRRYTAETLGEFGATALPALKTALSQPDTRVGAAVAIGWMGRDAIDAAPQLVEALQASTEPEARGECINALSNLRYDPARFIPLLFDSIRTEDQELRQAVINAILLIRPADQHTVPKLIGMIQGTSKEEQELAAMLLGRIGEAARAAVSPLIDRADSAPDEAARSRYALALTQIGAAAIPALLARAEARKDLPSNDWILGTISSMGEPAVSPLIAALADGTPAARQTVALSLKSLGPQAGAAAPHLFKLFTEPNPPQQAAAIATLAAIGADLTPLLPVMEEELASASPVVRSGVLEAAATMGARAAVLATALHSTLADKDPGVRAKAALALASILPQDQETIPRLSKAASDPSPEVQTAALQALGNLGPAAAPALPTLVEGAASESSAVRIQALASLGQIGSAAQSATPAIEKGLSDPDPAVRTAAIRAVALVETDRTRVLSSLRAALQDKDRPVRLSALKSLGELKRDARPATPELFSLLDKDEEIPLVLETLREIRVDSIEHLTDALNHRDEAVRAYASDTIGRLGAAAKGAIPRLRELFEDPSANVAREAREAVRNLERN